jgi:hypothetical protein
MDDQLDRGAVALEQPAHTIAVTDVYIVVCIASAKPALELVAIPDRRSGIAEEDAPHIIVDPNHLEALVGEEQRRLGANQAGRASDKCYAHCLPRTVEREYHLVAV